ncbi:hypothetical protein [Ensifer soli]|uniref:hypothetical protein n=1 Tax=Ciceribacter sp. sgz301302 TaxID=3342379 RepID=UPI0035B824B2
MAPKKTNKSESASPVEADQPAATTGVPEDVDAVSSSSAPSGESAPDGMNTGPADGEDQAATGADPHVTEGHDQTDAAAAAASVDHSEITPESDAGGDGNPAVPAGGLPQSEPTQKRRFAVYARVRHNGAALDFGDDIVLTKAEHDVLPEHVIALAPWEAGEVV